MPRDEHPRPSPSHFEKLSDSEPNPPSVLRRPSSDSAIRPPSSDSVLRPLPSERSGAAAPTRPPLHPLEKALLASVLVQLLFTVWAIGGSTLWAQIAAAALGACSFVLALLPRRGPGDHRRGTEVPAPAPPSVLRPPSSGSPSSVLRPPSSGQPSVLRPPSSAQPSAFRLSLFAFPPFWLGLALFALITIQGLNPAWEYHEAGGKWWLQGLPYRPWLPHGISIPFTWHWDLVYAGAWRTLLVYVPIWMAVCAVWIGVTRRRTLQILFTALPLSALGFSVLGVFQRATEPATIYGWYKPSLHWFFGPFVYKNHAGAYLLLMIGITCGLGLWYHVRGLRRLEKSSPAPVFAFVTLCLAIATVMSSARGATLAMIGYLVTVAIALVWYRSRVGHRGVSAAVAILLLVAAAGIVVVAVKTLHADTIWARLQQALVGRDDSVEQRMTANYPSSEMLADHWGLGIGAGSFAFLFPPYQQRYPAVVTGEFWPHAHNDLIEFPLELGLPGVLIIAAGFTFWIRQIVRTRAWENPLSGCVLLVAATLLVMSVGDYIFFSPAILLTWCCLWPAALRWAQLDEMPKSRKTDMPKLAS